MTYTKLSIVKYVSVSCLVVGLVAWNAHLQISLRQGTTKHSEVSVGNERRQRRSVSSPSGLQAAGALYIRWGRTTCPDDESELVYTGVAGGSSRTMNVGGGSDYLCVASEAQYEAGSTTAVEDGLANIYGLEYEVNVKAHEALFDMRNIAPSRLDDAVVVCSACRSKTRTSQLMIPGRKECYPGWRREYWGLLMTTRHSEKGWGSYICVDHAPETIDGGSRDVNQGNIYLVQGICGSLTCPQYVNGMELTCVVCSK